MDCSTLGFPVHHQLPEPAHIHVQFWRGIHPSLVQGAQEEKTDLTACGLEGGDRTPLKNFLQPPVERCCEERPGSWVQLWGWDVIFQQALVKSRKSGRAGS